MTFVLWAVTGVVIGYLVGRARGLGMVGAVVGFAGAIVGGLIGTQLWGHPIALSFDLFGDVRAIIDLFLAREVDISGSMLGTAAASALLLLAVPNRPRVSTSA